MVSQADGGAVAGGGAIRGLLVVLAGPSGVGKSTIARRVSEQLGLVYAVSATTRPRRPGDQAGKAYEHITAAEFLRRLEAGDFLEYAQVYDQYYGTPRQAVLDQLAAGHDVLLEIDVQGALQVRYHYPQALLIFILPPDEAALLERLRRRGRDSADEITRRYRSAQREIHMARGARAFDAMVVNDDLDRVTDEVAALITSRRGAQPGTP
jgi:guanylate kinase